MVYEPRSPFRKLYVNDSIELRENTKSNQDEDITPIDKFKELTLISEIQSFLSENSKNEEGFWYDENLFNMHFKQGKSFRDISQDTGICRKSISRTIGKTQELIKNTFKDKYNDIKYK